MSKNPEMFEPGFVCKCEDGKATVARDVGVALAYASEHGSCPPALVHGTVWALMAMVSTFGEQGRQELEKAMADYASAEASQVDPVDVMAAHAATREGRLQ